MHHIFCIHKEDTQSVSLSHYIKWKNNLILWYVIKMKRFWASRWSGPLRMIIPIMNQQKTDIHFKSFLWTAQANEENRTIFEQRKKKKTIKFTKGCGKFDYWMNFISSGLLGLPQFEKFPFSSWKKKIWQVKCCLLKQMNLRKNCS